VIKMTKFSNGYQAPGFIADPVFANRLRLVVSAAWEAFARKVGGGLIPINKEASMQLQYAYLLKQMLPLILHDKTEHADLELETGVPTKSGTSNIDIVLRGDSGGVETTIAIEMKCYRTKASSGQARGAHDIFMKDVYEDLQILEEYVQLGRAAQGVALVMTDSRRLVAPAVKKGKCWAYDISQGAVFSGGTIAEPIGGKPVLVHLQNNYWFDWAEFGGLWFMEMQGIEPAIGT